MNRNIIITGGANGIGRCTAETFAKAGDRVFIIDKDGAAARRLSDRFPGQIVSFVGDMAEKTAMDAFVAGVKAHCGQVHVLVNNACFGAGGLKDCSYEQFSYVLAMGVTAPFYLTQQLADVFAPGASVINIASTRAFMSQENSEAYAAAKGGISALTHAMCVSLAGKVRVNAISPGWIETAHYHEGGSIPEYSRGDIVQHPAGRVGVPEDIAKAILFLVSDEASFIDGQNLCIDGGMTKLMVYHNDCGWKLEV